MKTYIADIIPKLQRFSQKLDNLTLLTNQHWVVLSEMENTKLIYIFRSNQELLIVKNGKVEKAKWEYIGNKSILIDNGGNSYLFKHGFFDENVLALKVDGKDEYAILVNENKYEGEINSVEMVIEFLSSKYLKGTFYNSDMTISTNTPNVVKNNQGLIKGEHGEVTWVMLTVLVIVTIVVVSLLVYIIL